MTTHHGVLVVDKPRGPTSHDVVAAARRLFGTRAVGHAGTLDPMATGVLLLLVGDATKLSAYLTANDKRYRAEIQLGRSTDTLDAEGATTEERSVPELEVETIEGALDAERERTEQVPPAASAVATGGERAHRRFRRGETVELAPRPVRILDLTLLRRETDRLDVELTVSKGYYVRAFARDVGERLGVPAHLATLRRLASGPFTIDEAIAWPPPAPPALIGVADAAVRALPSAPLTAEGARRAALGQKLDARGFDLASEDVRARHEADVVAWLAPDGTLVALGRAEDDDFRVVRGFHHGQRE